jgi:hypothetical protein
MVFAIDISENPIAQKYGSISSILNTLLPLLTIGAFLLFLATALWGAFSWLRAGDSTENVKKAQKILTYAVIGLILVAVSYTAVKLVAMILQINLPI